MRARVQGTMNRPRFSVFRSNRHLLAQLIDDTVGHTLVAANDKEIKPGKTTKGDVGGKKGIAQALGELLAKRAQEAHITAVAFDRGGYRYHGLIQAIAEGARKGGLRF